MTKKMMVFVAKVGIDPTAFPLLGERSIQLSYSATSRCCAMFEEDSLLLWSVQTLFQGHVEANLLEGRRSFEYALITRTLYPTGLLGDVETWRHVEEESLFPWCPLSKWLGLGLGLGLGVRRALRYQPVQTQTI